MYWEKLQDCDKD